ncbi:glycoside hydrolase family 3 protein [Sediminivirga luteola]|uniref:beta-N-acetylhexosaminidase n=1 Tax=Sediminivirga luteola TaxID=1774748 RepID=A0A8J2TX11_9MICO|nr:glycoside hydrolase family 3 N-terminal domain-containing protein [Sediminivirga luteola]MCI2265515.1 hypothetical protein [Sediminivirga luteola]GGA09929.1 beta-N-acetylhexosaminidase [Sediminivirga luteola]
MRSRLLVLLGALVLAVLLGGSMPPGQRAAQPSPPGDAAGREDSDVQEAELPPGPSGEDRERAQEIVAGMDDEELAGSVIVATAGADSGYVAELIRSHHLAGAIVMSAALPGSPDADDVRAVTAGLAAAGEDREAPVLISVDQEGGPVERLGGAAATMPPLMAHGAAGDEALTAASIHAQAAELRGLGFTMNFAPTADVTIGARDITIGVRAASDDPGLAARIAAAAVRGQQGAGLAASAKHFPGHGALTVDTHHEAGELGAGMEELREREFPPFAAAIEAGVASVMVGHIAFAETDGVPASMAPRAYRLLREEFGYDGVLVTDALDMAAARQAAPEAGQETVRALNAGADLALMPPDPVAAHRAVLSALESGDLDADRLQTAAERVVALQLWTARAGEADSIAELPALGGDPGLAEASPGELRTLLAERSLTVVAGQCRLEEPPEEVRLQGADAGVREWLAGALGERGVQVTDTAAEAVVLGRGSIGAGDAAFAVSLGAPWILEQSDAAAKLAVYHDGPEALDAVAAYVAGELTARGRLPAQIPGADDAPDC